MTGIYAGVITPHVANTGASGRNPELRCGGYIQRSWRLFEFRLKTAGLGHPGDPEEDTPV